MTTIKMHPDELLGPSPLQIQHYLDTGLLRLQEDHERPYIGLSKVGSCRRQQWFAVRHGEDPEVFPIADYPPDKLRLFRDGNVYEQEFLNRLDAAGLTVYDRQSEVVWPHPALRDTVRGHIDGRILVPTAIGEVGAVVECKRVGGAKALKNTGSIFVAWPHYVQQLAAYMHCAGCPLGVLLVSDKSDRQMSVYEGWYQLLDGLVYDLADNCCVVSIHELEQRLMEVEDARKLSQPPPRDYEPRGRDWQCEYCDFKEHCLELGV